MSKTTKLNSSKLLSISKQRKNVDEPLRNRTYLGKELYLNFFGCRFSLTHGHRHEKQVVLGPITFKAPQSGDKKQVFSYYGGLLEALPEVSDSFEGLRSLARAVTHLIF